MNVSQPPCRLTMRPPNENAKDLFFGVKKDILEDRSNFQKYGCIGGWAVTGVILFIVFLIIANVLGSFFILAICLAFGACFHFSCQEDAPSFQTDNSGNSTARKLAASKLEERIKTGLGSCRPTLEALEHAPQLNNVSSLNSLVDTFFRSYKDMNIAGCVPKSTVATYAAAWTVLASHYENKNYYVGMSHPRFNKIKDLHDKWVDLVVKATEAAHKVTAGMDRQRLKARKQAMSQATGAVTDFMGIYDSVEILKSLNDIKGSLGDLQQAIKDSKGVKTDDLEPRTGIHDITKRRLIMFFVLLTAINVPFIALFAALDVPEGAWIMAGLYVLMLGVMYWANMRYGNSFNALEDLYNAELYIRSAIKLETEKNPPAGQERLCAATNMLRDHIMDAYYDTLGIHLQTELLTFGTLPPINFEPTPLFWNSQIRAASGGGGRVASAAAVAAGHATTASPATSTSIALDEEGNPDDCSSTGPAAHTAVDEEACLDNDSYISAPPSRNALSQSGRQSSFGLAKPEVGRGRPGPMMDDDDMPSHPRRGPGQTVVPAPVPAPFSVGGDDIEYGSA